MKSDGFNSILIVDDVRDCHQVFLGTKYEVNNPLGFNPEDRIIICRTYSAAIAALNSDVFWTCVFIDHDLGHPTKTGYDFMCEIEKRFFMFPNDRCFLPQEMYCVSQNPSGKAKIEACWRRIQRELEKENQNIKK